MIRRVVIAAGGTGGHVFPAIALADALRRANPGVEILFVGAKGGREVAWVQKAGYPIRTVWISGLYRQITLKNVVRNSLLPLKFLVGHVQSYRILKQFKPQVVIGLGGYASYTTLGVANRMKGMLRVIQEQNAFPGLTNRTHAKDAHLVLLGHAAALRHFPHGQCVVTGNPVRQQLLEAHPAWDKYGFDPAKPLLFLTGGSLGARTLNRAMAAAVDRLRAAGVQVLWQCGSFYYQEYKHLDGNGVKIVPFVEDMGAVYAMASLVVCRAGALTIAELEALQMPAILIPSPNVADDHQTKNAEALRQLGGALVLKDAEAETRLADEALNLLTQPDRLQALKDALQIPYRNAADQMVQAIERQWQILQGDPFGKGKNVYCSGIGGIGMSALARYLQAHGCTLSGYDRTPTPLTRQLEAEGMKVWYEMEPERNLQGIDSLLYTPAVGEKSPDLDLARQRELPVWKRAQLLGHLARRHQTLAVAGTHGKTTTSSLLSYLLREGGQDPTCFVGGLMTNYETNYLEGKGPWMVAEADEYDRSFLHLFPRHLILTSLDADHLDIYGTPQALRQSYNQLVAQTEPGGLVVAHESTREFIHIPEGVKGVFYGLESDEVHAEDIRYAGLTTHFTYVRGDLRISGLELNRPGAYNLLNALAAITVALEAGLHPDRLRNILPLFAGVKRRFEVQINAPGLVYVDDYAHHPAEIEACLGAVRDAWPGYRIIAIFQPHLFTRTRDFYVGFGQSLSVADAVYLMHIYPARELSIPHVTSDLIYQQITHNQKRIINLQEVGDAILPDVQQPCVVISLGAGDIDTQVETIRLKLSTLL